MPGATAMARIVLGDGVVNATLLASDGVTLKESTTALLYFTMGFSCRSGPSGKNPPKARWAWDKYGCKMK